MKKILFILLLCPFISPAQKSLGRYENDTLYTSNGFKIYKGQTLQFGKATGSAGRFRYVNIKNDVPPAALANNTIVVKRMKNFGISALGNGYIEIIGTMKFSDGSKGYVDIHMAFDKVMESLPGFQGELIVPEEFRNKQKLSVADEISKLNKLYMDGIITKEQFEEQKAILLKQ